MGRFRLPEGDIASPPAAQAWGIACQLSDTHAETSGFHPEEFLRSFFGAAFDEGRPEVKEFLRLASPAVGRWIPGGMAPHRGSSGGAWIRA
jgi:hypothetical protein